MKTFAVEACSQTGVTQTADVILLDLPASLKYLNIAGACLAAIFERIGDPDMPAGRQICEDGGMAGVGSDDEALATVRARVELALQETCTNIVVHAYGEDPGRIRITISVIRSGRRRALVIETHDTGPNTFAIDSVPSPNLEHLQEHGHGLFLVRQLMDEVSYDGRPGNSRWRLVKYL